MEPYKIKVKCNTCGGDGVIFDEDNVNRKTCSYCDGSGYIFQGEVEGAEDIDWIKKKIKKIMDKLEIIDL